MIHTCDVRCRLTEAEFEFILAEYGESVQRHAWQTEHLSGEGLTCVSLYRGIYEGIPRCSIIVSMNPQHVLTGQYDPLALFDSQAYLLLEQRFAGLMTEFTSVPLPSLCYWKAQRLDIAVDVEIRNDPQWVTATDYLDLARQGVRPGTVDIERVDWISYRDETNSVTVNFYHKGPELRSRPFNFDQDTYTRADSMLRFEVQCNKAKLSYLAQQQQFPGREFSHYMDESLQNKQIEYYAKRVVGVYDYFKVVRAASAMRAARRRIDVNKNIVRFLKAIAAAGGISPAREQWNAGHPIAIVDAQEGRMPLLLTNSQYYQRMKQLRFEQINAVPLPNGMRTSRAINPLIDFWRQQGLRE